MNDIHFHDDIIDMPHHRSLTHPHMPMGERAAQFAPFAALTGYDDAIDETARITEPRRELSEYEADRLDRALLYIKDHIKEEPAVTMTCFMPDPQKSGGSYTTIQTRVLKLTPQALICGDEGLIPLENIFSIDIASYEEI